MKLLKLAPLSINKQQGGVDMVNEKIDDSQRNIKLVRCESCSGWRYETQTVCRSCKVKLSA